MENPSSETSREAASEEQQAQDKVEVQTSQDLIDAHNERRQSTLGQQSEPNLERLTYQQPAAQAPDDAQAAEAQSVQDAPQAAAPEQSSESTSSTSTTTGGSNPPAGGGE